jgi:hypothetical protein
MRRDFDLSSKAAAATAFLVVPLLADAKVANVRVAYSPIQYLMISPKMLPT